MPYVDMGAGNFAGNKRMTDLSKVNHDYQYPDGLDFKPGSKLHNEIIDKIKRRATASYRIMSKRHPSWNEIDRTLTAYIDLDSAEEIMKEKDSRKPASIVFPYSYAIMETLLSYLVAAFFQDPIFRYEGVSPEDTIGAIMMEKVIDLHCNKSKVALNLHTMFRDNLAYGFGVTAPGWRVSRGWRTVQQPRMDFMGNVVGKRKSYEDTVLFEGNCLHNIDPYMCLPDPNVAIHDHQNGEFFGWIEQTNYLDLFAKEFNKENLFNVKYVKNLTDKKSTYIIGASERETRIGTSDNDKESLESNRVDLVNMIIKIIPKDWNLGDREYPEKWSFTMAADEILIKAKPLDLDHDLFPVVVAAADFDGYSSTPLSRIEMLNGMQGILDFLFNSHIKNVRKTINDMLIVDPYLVNVKDIEDPKEGKIIRLRRPAWGKGVKDVVHQLAVADVTKNHIADSSWIVQWMQKIGASDDAMMGSLRQGGPERLTSAEFEGTRSGAVSRLERLGRVMSLQALQDIGYMFASHAQQLMEQDLYVTTTGRWEETLIREYGDRVQSGKMKVSPFDLLINYDVKIRDGSVPGNNFSDVWVKMFQLIATEPRLQQKFDIVRIFRHIARNNGAKNVEEFEITSAPDTNVMQNVQQGNLVPLNQIISGDRMQ